MAAEKLALENPQDILVKSLTNYGFMKVNVCKLEESVTSG
jgi:hypothetical protein